MKKVAIIQARTSSTRLPEKVLMKLGDKPMLINIIERVARARSIDEVVVATSDEPADDKVEELLEGTGISCFRGSLDNVLERFYLCAKEHNADIVVRFTGDNALVDTGMIDEAMQVFTDEKVDYIAYKESFPIGMCIEAFTFAALERSYNEADDPDCREHVIPYIVNNPEMFKVLICTDESNDRSDLRFTVDTPEDYEFVRRIYDRFNSNDFGYNDILKVLKDNPDWLDINKIIRQKMYEYKGENRK